MATHHNNSKLSDWIPLLLGPIFVLCIGLATTNLLQTYKKIHHQKQESMWSIIQLDKEMSNTLFDAQQYNNGYLDEKPLRSSYEVLWSRFPITINSLRKDEILREIGGLTVLVSDAFNHIKSAEALILKSRKINKVKLNHWVNKLNDMEQSINQQLLHNIAASNSEYSSRTANKIIGTAAILMVLIAAFVLYLGFLLLALRKERSQNLYMLAHDTLTGLQSRHCIMQSIKESCDNKTPFALLSFDLNKFKAVNDTFGHHIGDQLLIYLADKFKKTLGKFGRVGRIGGDEFLWQVDTDDIHYIQEKYALFLLALQEPCLINGKRLQLKLSCGGGLAADYDYHPTQLLERIDEAMYQAKAQQINDIFWDNLTVSESTLNNKQLDADIKQASNPEPLEYS